MALYCWLGSKSLFFFFTVFRAYFLPCGLLHSHYLAIVCHLCRKQGHRKKTVSPPPSKEFLVPPVSLYNSLRELRPLAVCVYTMSCKEGWAHVTGWCFTPCPASQIRDSPLRKRENTISRQLQLCCITFQKTARPVGTVSVTIVSVDSPPCVWESFPYSLHSYSTLREVLFLQPNRRGDGLGVDRNVCIFNRLNMRERPSLVLCFPLSKSTHLTERPNILS